MEQLKMVSLLLYMYMLNDKKIDKQCTQSIKLNLSRPAVFILRFSSFTHAKTMQGQQLKGEIMEKYQMKVGKILMTICVNDNL